MARKTTMKLPVLLFGDRHVMSDATVVEQPNRVDISITITGDTANEVAAFLTAGELVALSFSGIPATPRSTHIKETN